MVVGDQTRVFGLGSPVLLMQLGVLGAEFSCQRAATLHFIIPISTNKCRAVQMSGRQRPVRDANDRAPTHTHTRKHTHTHTLKMIRCHLRTDASGCRVDKRGVLWEM